MYLKQILSEYTTTTAQYIYSTNTKVKVKAGSLTMIWFSFQTEFIAATRLSHTPPAILYDLENIFKKVQGQNISRSTKKIKKIRKNFKVKKFLTKIFFQGQP